MYTIPFNAKKMIVPLQNAQYLEPVYGASRDEPWELERAIPEFLSDGREAKNHMEVVLHSICNKILHILTALNT